MGCSLDAFAGLFPGHRVEIAGLPNGEHTFSRVAQAKSESAEEMSVEAYDRPSRRSPPRAAAVSSPYPPWRPLRVRSGWPRARARTWTAGWSVPARTACLVQAQLRANEGVCALVRRPPRVVPRCLGVSGPLRRLLGLARGRLAHALRATRRPRATPRHPVGLRGGRRPEYAADPGNPASGACGSPRRRESSAPATAGCMWTTRAWPCSQRRKRRCADPWIPAPDVRCAHATGADTSSSSSKRFAARSRRPSSSTTPTGGSCLLGFYPRPAPGPSRRLDRGRARVLPTGGLTGGRGPYELPCPTSATWMRLHGMGRRIVFDGGGETPALRCAAPGRRPDGERRSTTCSPRGSGPSPTGSGRASGCNLGRARGDRKALARRLAPRLRPRHSAPERPGLTGAAPANPRQ